MGSEVQPVWQDHTRATVAEIAEKLIMIESNQNEQCVRVFCVLPIMTSFLNLAFQESRRICSLSMSVQCALCLWHLCEIVSDGSCTFTQKSTGCRCRCIIPNDSSVLCLKQIRSQGLTTVLDVFSPSNLKRTCSPRCRQRTECLLSKKFL